MLFRSQSPRWGILYMAPGTESTWVESKFNFEEKKLEHFLFLLSRCGVLMFQTYVASNLTSLPVNCISFNVATRQSRQGFESWAARARSKTDSPTNCIESGTRLLFAPTRICPNPTWVDSKFKWRKIIYSLDQKMDDPVLKNKKHHSINRN